MTVEITEGPTPAGGVRVRAYYCDFDTRREMGKAEANCIILTELDAEGHMLAETIGLLEPESGQERDDKFVVPLDFEGPKAATPEPVFPREPSDEELPQVAASQFGRVHASIGNGLEGYYEVNAPGNGSVVWRFEIERRADEELCVPSLATWERFWREVDRLDVWGWAPIYEAPYEVMDGTYWTIDLVRGDRSVRSSGANAYPDGDDPGRDFRAFCRALSLLAGGRAFA